MTEISSFSCFVSAGVLKRRVITGEEASRDADSITGSIILLSSSKRLSVISEGLPVNCFRIFPSDTWRGSPKSAAMGFHDVSKNRISLSASGAFTVFTIQIKPDLTLRLRCLHGLHHTDHLGRISFCQQLHLKGG